MNKIIPKHWELSTLGEIAQWGSGGTPSRSKSSFYNGTIPWIKTGDLNDDILNEVEEFITKEGLNHSSAKIFPKGSVVIAMYGATIGKTAILGIDAATNQACAVAQPYHGIDNKYLFYYLRSEKHEFIAKGKGGAQPNISQTVIKEHSFPLAPGNEQKQISKKLDEIFNHLDNLNIRLDRIPQLVKVFKEKILTYAITGKLTEGWRVANDISVEPTLDRIIELRKKIDTRKTGQISINLRTDIELFSIPENWRWVDLAFLFDESDNFCYGVVQPGKEVFDGQKLIRIKDLGNWKINHDELRTISKGIDDEYKRSRVKEGDILLTVVGTIGRTAIVTEKEEGYNIARAIAKIPIRKEFNVAFLNMFFNSTFAQNLLIGEAREVARKTLNLDQLKTLPIALPPKKEQDIIVDTVNNLFTKCDSIEFHYHKLLEAINVLPKNILTNAFNGKLIGKN
jgi:type I restriction enzyme, S subunit